MIPSFNPVLDREPLGPSIAAIDLGNCGVMAEHGARIIAHLERVDSLAEKIGDDFLAEAGTRCLDAFTTGLARARAATAPGHLAMQHWTAVTPPHSEPSLEVLREHMARAASPVSDELERRARAMRIGTTREYGALVGLWREAIDRCAHRLDPAERQRVEDAYAAAANIKLTATWPTIRFEEIGR